MNNYVLTLHCLDRPGIVAAVVGRLAESGGDITEAQQFDDRETGRFFMRVAFETAGDINRFRAGFAEEVERFGLLWTLRPADARRKAPRPTMSPQISTKARS